MLVCARVCVCVYVGWGWGGGEQIDQKTHAFRFGSLVKDEYILEPRYKGYQDIVYSLFNIATLQSFKWKFDKGTQVLQAFPSLFLCMCGHAFSVCVCLCVSVLCVCV